MHEHLDLIGADAAGFRRVGIAADRIDVPADLQMRQNDMSDHDDDQENDDRAGDNAEHIVVANPAVCVAETGDGAAACDEQRRTADDRQKAECDDIRSKLALCDQNADDHADERAGENAAQEADRERCAGLDNHRGDDAGQADDRTDGNINTGRDQHVCNADGQNAVDRCLVEHENQVRRRQE